KKFWVDDAGTCASLDLLETTIRALPDILAGRQRAANVIFPNSSMKLVEGVYKHNRVADYFNELLSAAVVAYVEGRICKDPKAAIRILEIGAGTGGSSARVFDKVRPLAAHIQEYWYTDVSKAFLIHGEREYISKNPYLKFKLLDVENPPERLGADEDR